MQKYDQGLRVGDSYLDIFFAGHERSDESYAEHEQSDEASRDPKDHDGV